MKKVLIAALLLVLPTLFFLNVRQAVRFEQLERRVKVLQGEQSDWLERNKRAIAAIEILTSPRRLDELATEDLGLTRIDAGRITVVRIRRERGDE
jgi:hypothetical protein